LRRTVKKGCDNYVGYVGYGGLVRAAVRRITRV
jgi:hypothetical protein